MATVSSHTRRDETEKVTWLGVGINIGLSLVKFVVGIVGASQAVVADAVHSLSDLVTDFAVLLGVRVWTAPPDENHPYGHQRIEALITTSIALALAGVAVGLSYKAVSTLRAPHEHPPTWIALLGPALSIVVKEALFRWTLRVGQRIQSPAVVANAWHHRSDAWSSYPALLAVGIAVIHPAWTFADHLGAVIVSLFILRVAGKILRPALGELTDQAGSQDDRERIRFFAEQVEGVREVHHIRTRRFGTNLQVDLHVLVDPALTVKKGHDISEAVKRSLITHGHNILDVVVHLEPYELEQK